MRCRSRRARPARGDGTDAAGIPWQLPGQQSAQNTREGGGLGATDLHVRDHLCASPPSATQCKHRAGTAALTIVALSLFAEPGEERLAAGVSMSCTGSLGHVGHTFRAVDGVSMLLTFIIDRAAGARGASHHHQVCGGLADKGHNVPRWPWWMSMWKKRCGGGWKRAADGCEERGLWC